MGCSPFRVSSSSCEPIKGDPVPTNFFIRNHRKVGDHLVIMINYPDCINYEGNKIIVYKNTNIQYLLKRVYIDPHFIDNGDLKPFARFEPTKEGFLAAIELAKLLD